MDGIVYATRDTRLQDKRSGLSYEIHRNQPWAADDPLVRQNPSFFSPEPPQLMRTVLHREPDLPRVEQATRAPGETRKKR